MDVIPNIVATGLVTPLGRSTVETWDSLLRGEAIQGHSAIASSMHRTRVIGLATEAAMQAMQSAGWTNEDRRSTAVIIGTSKGPVENWLSESPTSRKGGPLLPVNFGLAEIASAVATATGLTDGARLTLSAACASGLHALIRGCMMIRAGEVERVLVVAAEASVHRLFLGGFQRLGVLAPSGGLCQPFDRNRHGFLMSDAAAAVCLEAGCCKTIRGIRVERFAMGGEANHLTGGESDGAVLTHLLKQVMPDDVDLIHAHGTGTLLNDSIELAAIEANLHSGHKRLPVLFSHKGAIGHSLGASGLVSVVLNCLCHQTGTVPGNINTPDPMPSTQLMIPLSTCEQKVVRSVAIASGFGGPTAVVSLSS